MKITRLAFHGAVTAALLLAAPCWGADASAKAGADSVRVPVGSAATVRGGQWDVGVVSPLRVGVSDRVQISTQAVTVWIYPHVDLQYRWLQYGQLTLAARLRLAYPTLLLHNVAREGSLGLLPPTSKIPPMLGVHGELLATQPINPWHGVTSSIMVSTAPRLGESNFPVLDFPFLYSRFAHTKTLATWHFGVAFHGFIGTAFSYWTDITYSLLPLPELRGGFATEQSAFIGWHFARHWVVRAGERVSVAHLPVGLRMHYLPVLDLRVGF